MFTHWWRASMPPPPSAMARPVMPSSWRRPRIRADSYSLPSPGPELGTSPWLGLTSPGADMANAATYGASAGLVWSTPALCSASHAA